MADVSDRLGLPLMAAAQAQKEMTHNEALALADIVVQPVVVAVDHDDPPSAPEPGQCWIVGPAPSGAWTGHAGSLAGWTSGGWRFVVPFEGMATWSLTDGAWARYHGSAWVVGSLAGRHVVIDGTQVVGAQQAAIGAPVGGSLIDVESRAAIVSILATMQHHGLIAS